MEHNEDLNNEKYFGNVRRLISKTFFFNQYLLDYDSVPAEIEICTYNEDGKILNRKCEYTRRYGEVMGYDLYNSNTDFIYNDTNFLEKIIDYDDNFKVDCTREYILNDDNTISKFIVNRNTIYQTTEFQYDENKTIKILIDSISGEIKRDFIYYDNLKRIIKEESIFKKITGNYSVKNPTKKYYYENDIYIIEHYLNDRLTSKEYFFTNGKLIKRTNYDDFGKLYSSINVEYNDNIITTICLLENGEELFKTVDFLDINNNLIKRNRYKNGNILDFEIIFEYDDYKNCRFEELINHSKTITNYEYY